MHRSRLGTIVIDCHADDAGPAAEFWSRALGWAAQPLAHPDDANYRELATPPSEVKVLVQAVAHPSRVHVDIETDDIDAEVARLEALGARRVDVGQGDVSWVVMADPDGNEFDVLRPLPKETELAR